jgi:tRNA-(ms[2]io[6]A)-hydroxylase
LEKFYLAAKFLLIILFVKSSNLLKSSSADSYFCKNKKTMLYLKLATDPR